jgi:hypothetical protein
VLKIGVTGWRMLRYYTGSTTYRRSGPPPALLRALGPLVVLSTVAVLGSGSLLIALGQRASRDPLLTVLGHRIDWVTVHQGSVIAWAVTTGLHVLARIVPSLRLAQPAPKTRVDGRRVRVVALLASMAIAAGAAYLVLGASDSWRQDQFGFQLEHDDG